jgi:hypothetical protein
MGAVGSAHVHALLAGAIGLVCLISFAIGKPIFLLFLRRPVKNTADGSQLEGVLANPLVVKRITNLTLIIGIAALADAVVQTVLALALSTSAFLVATTVIHIATGIVIGVFLLFWIRSRSQRMTEH